MATGPTQSENRLEALSKYTACDIADTLLALKVPNAGYLPDLHVIASGERPSGSITIAPASTVLMVPKSGGDLSGLPEPNISAKHHYVDLTQPDTIVVLQQPQGQKCAVLGGIMALRTSILKAKGVVVSGRVRDVQELKQSGLLVGHFSKLQNAS